MTNQTETRELSRLESNMPEVPAFLLHGEDAETIYLATQEILSNELGNNSHADIFKYNPETKRMTGSNSFGTGLVYRASERTGLRPAVPSDDRRGDISKLLAGRFYSDFNALGVQETKPRYEKNNGIWRRVIELAEETQGSVEFPFMVQGFYIIQDESEQVYGLSLAKAPNFRVISDDRLSEKYNEWKFNEKDELGLPKDLDKNKGNRTFFTRGDGVSRAFSDGNGGLYFNGDDLAGSGGAGRVVLVGAEGTRENFDAYLARLRKIRASEVAELDERFTKAERILRGE